MSEILEEENPEDRPEREDDPHLKNRFCKDCGAGPFTLYELGNHSKSCPEAIERRAREKEIEESLKEKPTPESGKPKESPYLTEQEPSSILREILSKHPGISDKVAAEVMEWAELYETLQPTQLPYILTSMGVKHQTASLITQKYFVALQRANQAMTPYSGMGMMPALFPPSNPQMPGMMFPNIPQQPQIQQPQYVMTPMGPMLAPQTQRRYNGEDDGLEKKYATKEYLQTMIENIRKKSEMDELKSEFKELRDYITRSGGRGQDNAPPGGMGYIEERVPIDEKGNIVHPNQAVSVRYVRRPVQSGTYATGPDQVITQKLAELEKKFTDTQFDALRKEIEDLKRPREDGPYAKEMKQKLDASLQKVDALSEKLDEQEKEQLYGAIDDLRRKLDNVSQGEYKEDTMRIIGNGVNKLADVMERKAPLQTLGDIFFPQTRIQPHAEDIVVQPGGGNLIVQERLAQEGLTAHIQQQTG
jgi:hypothetical protein